MFKASIAKPKRDHYALAPKVSPLAQNSRAPRNITTKSNIALNKIRIEKTPSQAKKTEDVKVKTNSARKLGVNGEENGRIN